MTKLIYGIASVAEQRARSLAIADGTRKRDEDEPTVWFPSLNAMTRIISNGNMAMLTTTPNEPERREQSDLNKIIITPNST